MNELHSILHTWRTAGPDVDAAVLATVVHVKGSAYRRPGARMLILPDGRRIGTISGGCLEGDVARKAGWWTSNGGTALRTFDNSSEDAAWDFGLGCNGVITVLLERLDTPGLSETIEFIEASQTARKEVVIATVIRVAEGSPYSVGNRILWDATGPVSGPFSDSELAAGLSRSVEATLAERTSRLVHLPESDVFVEWIGPPQRLVVFGAGHDVVPLVALGRLMGWSITVADGRSAYAQPGRFPGAERIVSIPVSGDISEVGIDDDTAVVLMTHNYPQDLVLLPQILARAPRYLGLLGPRTRTEKLFAESGLSLPAEEVYAPIGLDIGGEHPETIALSIVAEIQAVLARRMAGSLRFKKGAIHAPVKETGRTTLHKIPVVGTGDLAACNNRVHLEYA